ncbi:tetratricopeptide repeat protein [Motiliproteus sp. SC1-56]|uniref:tetratricopeptide repeat protein n=1 Tax=Motiliproteus sp. SC1-56 TaxID=2799565 RepID=UPI001A8FBAF9|nr:tetratricopeptide repeat protein [Motiliproteus sp. SC1-56]
MSLGKPAILAFIGLTAARSLIASPLPEGFADAQPRVQLYMAYAQFKMANYTEAETMWRHVKGPARAEAAFNLGILYEQGLGVKADMAQALRFYRQGAEAGSRAAAYQLGLIYLEHSEFRDRQQAEHWLSVAALDGDSDAAALLQQLDNSSAPNDPMDEVRILLVRGEVEQALMQLTQMAQAMPPDYRAVTRLAWLYETGLGVERNIETAARLFRQAAEAGIAEAQYALALMLQTGVGQAQNLEQASYWLRQSAAQGYPPAVRKTEAAN